jgi:hypothetical protein
MPCLSYHDFHRKTLESCLWWAAFEPVGERSSRARCAAMYAVASPNRWQLLTPAFTGAASAAIKLGKKRGFSDQQRK